MKIVGFELLVIGYEVLDKMPEDLSDALCLHLDIKPHVLSGTNRDWKFRSCRKNRWSDESRFLLHMTDGLLRVWRQRSAAFAPRNIQETVPFDGLCHGLGMRFT